MNLTAITDHWQGRPTYAVIDLDAFAQNVRTMREYIGDDAKYCVVVKANGYGLGAIPLSRVALDNGADLLAVATVDEGAQLRRAGINGDILLMGPMGPGEMDLAVGMNMTGVSQVLRRRSATNGFRKSERILRRQQFLDAPPHDLLTIPAIEGRRRFIGESHDQILVEYPDRVRVIK